MAGCERTSGRLLLLISAVLSCSRNAEIASDPDGGISTPSVPRDQSPLHPVDIGLDGGSFTACAERPSSEECRGANDFPCNFQPWAVDVVVACQEESGCVANGRVVIEMGDDGCVAELLMSEPNRQFARCALARLGASRCECRRQTVEATLGYGNEGCGLQRCGAREFTCPLGQSCDADGFCRPDGAAAGGAPG